MAILLSEVEARVVSALVEKQITTPEYYPLTVNALIQACNQKNNREPVVAFDETTVTRALETLRDKNLVYVFYGSTSRVPKYKHMMPEVCELNPQQLALLCTLMLRGHQTIGELKERAHRLAEFTSLSEVEEVLSSLIAHELQPMVTKLARQSGQKDPRYAHLLTGEVVVDTQNEHANYSAGTSSVKTFSTADRLIRLETDMASLHDELTEIRQKLDIFIKQFED